MRMRRALLLVGLGLLGLKLADLALGLRADPAAEPLERDRLSPERTLLSLEPYPYEGWHLPAHFHHTGPLPREARPEGPYDLTTGDMGFMTEFPLLAPPRKEPRELRVVLTGGSGAQGWGASSNSAMLDRRLEARLSAALKGRRVRVINLAMAGSGAYQNFIALNRYAHPLEPDLLVAVIGYNDARLAAESGGDGYFRWPQLAAFVAAARARDALPALEPLRRLFPNAFGGTDLGLALNLLLGRGRFVRLAQRDYERERGVPFSTLGPARFLSEVTVPQAALALNSMKRDFEGVPMLVAWQPAGPWPAARAKAAGLSPAFYNDAFKSVRAATEGRVNRAWRYVDLDAELPGAGPHLDDAQQERAAGLLAPLALELLRGR